MLDGIRLLPSDSPLLRERSRLRYNGVALVTLVLDGKGRPQDDPQITFDGVLDAESEGAIGEDAQATLRELSARQPAHIRRDDEAVAEATRVALRRHLFKAVGKKPITRVHVVRLS